MKIVSQDAVILKPESPMKHIERIGRICYKSEDKISDGIISDGINRKFVLMLFNNRHHAMLEHYRFIVRVSRYIFEELKNANPRYVTFTECNDNRMISLNARTLIELVENCQSLKNDENEYLPIVIAGIREDLINHIVKYKLLLHSA